MNGQSKMRQFLNKFFKIFIIFLLGTAVINVALVVIIYGSHKSKLKEETVFLQVPGELVQVNGHDIHVMVEGNKEAEMTLLFIHSADVADDSVALLPLFENLGDDYRLVLVERSGVGFSENSGSSRDIDNMLEETRIALDKVGVKGPFVVVAVGTAGLEVVHWINKYPSEILSVVGINMNYPEQFAEITAEEYCGFFDYLLVPFCKIGAHRLVGSIFPVDEYDVYTESQMLTRKALVARGGFTQDMYNENLMMVDNAAKVAEGGWPQNTQMKLIYANPLLEPYLSSDENIKKTYDDAMEANSEVDYQKEYNAGIREFFSGKKNITVEEMAGPARLYTYNPDELATKIKDYIEEEMLQ